MSLPKLDPPELKRYARHLNLPEVGLEGQRKLKSARVLLIGTGGLGSPLGLYLVAAGVGTLGLVDFDRVEESNLQRQVLHGSSDVGRSKLESAKDRLSDLNPYVDIQTHETRLEATNALKILADYDVVVDGSDNFPTRYLVNDACVLLGKPNVHGSIFRFEGQVSIFHPPDGPCYRCLHPEPPPPGTVPSCAEGGVLGILPGVVGTLQATETVKLILGAGRPLLGRLLSFDALAMTFREMKLPSDPECPLCGLEPTIKELMDYEQLCGLSPTLAGVTPRDFLAQWQSGRRPLLLDVRQPFEWEVSNLEEFGARLIPLSELSSDLDQFDKDADIVVHCQSGGRSARAVELMVESGFSNVRNLEGGMARWADEVSQQPQERC